ncbi:MAG: glycosyltransferase family 9 protein [Candidatus Neomarinimicrobiota bacterium]
MGRNRLLILRFSSIGDIVLTTAVVEYLHRKMPGYEFHFLTLRDYGSILEGNPHLARIILVERSATVGSLRRLAMRLSDFDYDFCLDLHNSLRTKYIRWWLKNRHWLTYRKPRLNRFLLFYLHHNRFGGNYDVLSDYWALLNGENGERPNLRPRLYISSLEKERARLQLKSYGISGDFAAVIPSAAWRSKIWPVAGYIEVLTAIAREEKLGIVLLGGSSDSVCDDIASQVPDSVNLRGVTDLRTSLAILSCARAAIGSDTGLIHGAEALGTPVVMINGPTSRETGARVRRRNSVMVTAHPWCQPCSKNGSRPCYRTDRFCMTGIRSDAVFTSFKSLLNGG